MSLITKGIIHYLVDDVNIKNKSLILPNLTHCVELFVSFGGILHYKVFNFKYLEKK